MKKILFWATVTILAVASCNKIEEGAPVGESNVPSFEASVDGADTKTIIDGFKSYWDGAEEIWVMTGESLDWKKKYSANASKASHVTFKETDNTILKGDDYLAIYPALPAGSVSWDGSIESAAKMFWLEHDQKPTVGSYDPSTHIAVAYTKAGNHNLEFKNVNSLVKFTIQSDNVTEVCFYGNNSEKIAGNFDVNYNNGNPTAINSTITYAKLKGSFNKGKTYYISVLPTNFEKGFSVEIVVDGVKHTLKNTTKYTLSRNQILDLKSITWEIPSEANKKTIYFKPNGWANDGAWFDAWCWGGGDTWATFKKSGESGIYYANVPSGTTGMKLYRRGPDHTGQDWDHNQWNNSGDQTLNGNNFITEGSSFGSFNWSKK